MSSCRYFVVGMWRVYLIVPILIILLSEPEIIRKRVTVK